jgi:ParB-like chromosome segregation protein Spo0J
MNIEHIAIGALAPYARNARLHDEAQIALLARSIEEYGFNNPVLIDAQGGIIAGHGRVLAAQKLGRVEVPCLRLAHLTEAQKRAYIIADNKLSEASRWDFGLLADEVRELMDEDGLTADLLAFDDAGIDRLFGEFTADGDDDPLDANAAGSVTLATEPTASPRQPDKAPPLLVPILISLSQADMRRWRDIKKAAGIDDNTAAFRRLVGIEPGEAAP